MKVVFFGNHTVGVTALKVLNARSQVLGVVAHPNDPEDGVRYESVAEYATYTGLPVIRGKATDQVVSEFVLSREPDLIWVTDYRYILPPEIIAIPRIGAINLHPSLLPKYRGRAPINWAIIHGETELGLTAHFIDSGVDSGDILCQERYTLTMEEDVGDALAKLYPLYTRITSSVVSMLKTDRIQRIPQRILDERVFPARKPNDGLISWSQTSTDILNLIRAVADPYPGAFSFLGNVKLKVWKAKEVDITSSGKPGQVMRFLDGSPVVACGCAAIALTSYEVENNQRFDLKIGDRLAEQSSE